MIIMNKIEFIQKLSDKSGISKKETEHLVNSMVELIIDTLRTGSEVTITGFGTFSARERHARMGVNPQKPDEPMKIPKVTVPKFKAGKTLKDALKAKDI